MYKSLVPVYPGSVVWLILPVTVTVARFRNPTFIVFFKLVNAVLVKSLVISTFEFAKCTSPIPEAFKIRSSVVVVI